MVDECFEWENRVELAIRNRILELLSRAITFPDAYLKPGGVGARRGVAVFAVNDESFENERRRVVLARPPKHADQAKQRHPNEHVQRLLYRE